MATADSRRKGMFGKYSSDDDWSSPGDLLQRISSVAAPKQPAVERDLDFGFAVPRKVHELSGYDVRIYPSAPNGVFRGAPLIGGFSAIVGGLYCGRETEELVSVTSGSELLENAYQQLLFQTAERQLHADNFESGIADVLGAFCTTKLKRQLRHLTPFLQYEEVSEQSIVPLDLFLNAELGDYRHQLLLAAYLCERLIKAGTLKGRIYIDNSLRFQTQLRERLLYFGDGGYRFTFEPEVYKSRVDYAGLNPFTL